MITTSRLFLTQQVPQDAGLLAHVLDLGGVHTARDQHLVQAGLLLAQVRVTLRCREGQIHPSVGTGKSLARVGYRVLGEEATDNPMSTFVEQ